MRRSSEPKPPGQDRADRNDAEPVIGDPAAAAQGPIPEPVSAAENPAPAPLADSPDEARGRRILSTAFVMVGPDGHLTVELRDGRVLVLRDVVMRAGDYCGVRVRGGPSKARHCGGYADVVAARPGGGAMPQEPEPMISKPFQPGRGPAARP